MEPEAAIPEGAWSSLDGMYTSEEADLIIMSQLLANCSVTNELNEASSSGSFPFSICPSHEYSTTTTMEGIESFSTVGSNENNYTSGSHQIMATNYTSDAFCLWEGNTGTDLFLKQGEEYGMNQELSTGNVGESGRNQQGAATIYEKLLQLKRESDDQMRIEVVPENCKKRSCSSVEVQKNKRNVKSKKSQKPVLSRNIEDINNAMASTRGQSSSSCCSGDDDSNASHDHDLISGGVSPKGVADLNLNCKTRARRGSATDSQSVYARKRREKINTRLRILQNLVPNGTKVDISTMLEEAVQYVKFLQLQIKLLSSDDLWMYAPIVYNEIHMGMDLNS